MLPISSLEAQKKAIGASMVNGSKDNETKKYCSNNFFLKGMSFMLKL